MLALVSTVADSVAQVVGVLVIEVVQLQAGLVSEENVGEVCV